MAIFAMAVYSKYGWPAKVEGPVYRVLTAGSIEIMSSR